MNQSNTYALNNLALLSAVGVAGILSASSPQSFMGSGFNTINSRAYQTSQSMQFKAFSTPIINNQVNEFLNLHPEVRGAINKLDGISNALFDNFASRFELIKDWDTGNNLLAWHISTNIDDENILSEKESAFFAFADKENLAEQLIDVVIYIS